MPNVTPNESADCFLTARQTRARYGGVSDMWLHRRLHDASEFPQPVVICGRRFWRLSDLVAWERKAAENPSKSSRPRRESWQKLGDGTDIV
jgi:predicted DNA-binding transcriptional regulator AlpA